MSYGDIDRVARLIPDALHITIEAALAAVRGAASSDVRRRRRVRELIDTARELEGVARHASTHAAGVVISREPLTEVVPLQRATSAARRRSEALPTTQYADGAASRRSAC